VPVSEERVYSGTGARRKLIGVQLDFSGPLDASVASAAAHFRGTQPRPTRRSPPRVVRIIAASYIPATRSIRLTLVSVDPRKPLTVTASGLIGTTGVPVASLIATI
jgi:hypothetical protein